MPRRLTSPEIDALLVQALDLGVRAQRMGLRVNVKGARFQIVDTKGTPRTDWITYDAACLILDQGGWLI